MIEPKIITTLKTYSWSLFRADVIAGITVAMVALPLSLAIAIASDAPPETGLVTAIVAGFLISLLGGSRVQIGGPTGAFIVVVYFVIATHGLDGLIIATFMAGAILVIAGLLRAGRMIAFVPEAVINGFTIGIAIIIAASQLKDFFGLEVANLPADFLPKVEALWAARESFNPTALFVALLGLSLIVILRRLAPRLPGLIMVMVFVSALVALSGLEVDTIGARFGELPRALPTPTLPDLSPDRLLTLLPSALVIAFLAGVESLLSAMVADRMIGGKHRPDAELTAQGVANMASSLFGGLPATGAIARTATNIRAGGKTPVAGLVHALAVLLIMLLFAPLASYLAMPALAALLILVAWNMSEPQHWKNHLSLPWPEKLLLLTTLLLTVLVDLTVAVGVGVGLGTLIKVLREGRGSGSDWTPPER